MPHRHDTVRAYIRRRCLCYLVIMDSPTPDLRDAEHTMRDAEHTMRDVEHTIAARVVEHVKARRIGVNALVFVLGLVVGLCASRTPVGLTSKLLACPYHYDRLDTKFTLELLAKNAQLAELESKLGALVTNNSALATDNQRLVLELERLERLANATGTHFMWAFNDMLWV